MVKILEVDYRPNLTHRPELIDFTLLARTQNRLFVRQAAKTIEATLQMTANSLA